MKSKKTPWISPTETILLILLILSAVWSASQLAPTWAKCAETAREIGKENTEALNPAEAWKILLKKFSPEAEALQKALPPLPAKSAGEAASSQPLEATPAGSPHEPSAGGAK